MGGSRAAAKSPCLSLVWPKSTATAVGADQTAGITSVKSWGRLGC